MGNYSVYKCMCVYISIYLEERVTIECVYICMCIYIYIFRQTCDSCIHISVYQDIHMAICVCIYISRQTCDNCAYISPYLDIHVKIGAKCFQMLSVTNTREVISPVTLLLSIL